MVEDFYNRDFTESVVDDKTEMPQDELRFMQNSEETIKLQDGPTSFPGSLILTPGVKMIDPGNEVEDGHYQISLPFKDREASVSNNKSQALQRAKWLRKKP